MSPLSFYTLLPADFNGSNSTLFSPKIYNPPLANIQHTLQYMPASLYPQSVQLSHITELNSEHLNQYLAESLLLLFHI